MDDYQVTIDTFNRSAELYEEKFLENEVYGETYRDFFELIEPNQKSLLDIGCGPGSVSFYLANRIPDLRVTGIDPAPRMVELAQANVPKGKFYQIDARGFTQQLDEQTSDEGNRCFDLIACAFCIPYLVPEDVQKLIAECADILAHRGLLYLSFIEGDSQNSRMLTNARGESVFMSFYEVHNIKGYLANYGLDVVYEQRKCLDTDNQQADTDIFLIARCQNQD